MFFAGVVVTIVGMYIRKNLPYKYRKRIDDFSKKTLIFGFGVIFGALWMMSIK